jgi:hypothetical protein
MLVIHSWIIRVRGFGYNLCILYSIMLGFLVGFIIAWITQIVQDFKKK